MPTLTTPAQSADALDPAGLVEALLSVSLTGIILFRPIYEATGTTIVDLAYERLNSAAQQMLRLPEYPAESFLTLYPSATNQEGVFAFYRDTFVAEQLGRHQFNYQYDGLDGYFYLVAQRQGERLVVSFTDTNDQPRSVVEEALRQSQARERAARAEAEQQSQRLTAIVEQSPVAIGYFEGPELLVTAANHMLSAMWGRTPAEVVGRPLLEGVPELKGQGFEDLMQQVRKTGVPFVGTEAPAQLLRDGKLQTTYYNYVYQPLYDKDGAILGIIDVAAEVTEQVQARQQVQALNRELAAANEELQVNNAEYLQTNRSLANTQQQLHQLNQNLEARVQQRTRQLAEQQELLSQILSEVPATVATLSGPAHRFSFANAAYQLLVAGRAKLGSCVADALPEVVEQGFIELLDNVYTTGQPFIGREMAITLAQADAAATPQYFNFTYQPLTDEHGQVQGILTFAVEVTEQVLANRQAATLQAAMLAVIQRQAQAREDVYQLFEQAPAAVCLLRAPDHRLDYLNPAYQAFFPGQQLEGKTFLEGRPEAHELVTLLDDIYQTGTAQMKHEVPMAIPAHDGQPAATRYFDFSYQAYREQGHIAGISLFGIDTTDRVLARQHLQDLNAELASTNQALSKANTRLTHTNNDLDTFVYTASHDLKSPITNIEGLLTALRHQLPAETLQQENVTLMLGMMDNAVSRFQATLGHLTDVSRLQDTAFNQPAAAIELAALAEDIRLDIAPELQAAGATLQVEVTECTTFYFSPKNLRSILYNLLSNAIKYRDPARPAQVFLRCHVVADHLILEVQDNGLGLDERQRSSLFRLFRRLHTHVSGSGVGLYMVKKMVDNAGGTLTVESQPGVGSTFAVTLPIISKPL